MSPHPPSLCSKGLSEQGAGRGALTPQILKDQVTISNRGAYHAHQITTSPNPRIIIPYYGPALQNCTCYSNFVLIFTTTWVNDRGQTSNVNHTYEYNTTTIKYRDFWSLQNEARNAMSGFQKWGIHNQKGGNKKTLQNWD